MAITKDHYEEIMKSPHIVMIPDYCLDKWKKFLLNLLIGGKNYEGLIKLEDLNVVGSKYITYYDDWVSDRDELVVLNIIVCSNEAATTIVKILNDAIDGANLAIEGNVIYDNEEPVTLQQVLLKYLS